MNEYICEDYQSKKPEEEGVSCIVILIIIFLIFFGGCVGLCKHADENLKEKRYKTWCKYTGNPKKLSFEEWKYLPKNIKEYKEIK